MQQENKKEPKKRVLIQLRTNEDDKRTLREYARLAGMTITDFVKSCTLGKAPRTKMATPEREVLIRLLAELGKIGSNVNQIAKAINAGHYFKFEESATSQTLEEIRKTSAEILKQLNHGGARTQEGQWQSISGLSAEQSG